MALEHHFWRNKWNCYTTYSLQTTDSWASSDFCSCLAWAYFFCAYFYQAQRHNPNNYLSPSSCENLQTKLVGKYPLPPQINRIQNLQQRNMMLLTAIIKEAEASRFINLNPETGTTTTAMLGGFSCDTINSICLNIEFLAKCSPTHRLCFHKNTELLRCGGRWVVTQTNHLFANFFFVQSFI